jgi:putative heme-binding domain-containing protein
MSLSRSTARPGPGNAERGAAVYQSSSCGSCHVVDGRGGILGPELTAIGGRRGAVYLRESIVKPAASHPPGYLVVRAVPNNGPEIRGIRVNEDVFWIHIRDAGGTVHALQKSELARLDRELEGTLMPSYESRLSAVQLDDLVAYLGTLRGAK